MAETEPRSTDPPRQSVTTAGDATTMQAVVQSMYGGPEVLEFAEVEKPMPDDDEALVRVVAIPDMVHPDSTIEQESARCNRVARTRPAPVMGL